MVLKERNKFDEKDNITVTLDLNLIHNLNELKKLKKIRKLSPEVNEVLWDWFIETKLETKK